jgi:transcriptional regulator
MPLTIRPSDRELLNFLQQYPCATLVTSYHNRPVATHLPLVLREFAGQIYLYGLLDKAGKQWKYLEFEENLVIFQKPHIILAANSQKNDNQLLAVHVYGICNLIHEVDRMKEILDWLKDTPDTNFHQWIHQLADERGTSCLVAFELRVTDLQPVGDGMISTKAMGL